MNNTKTKLGKNPFCVLGGKMNLVKEQAIIEAMLFSTGREIKVKEIMNALELGSEDIEKIMQNMKLFLYGTFL